jgi:predicted RNA-binding Zn-ribbon protein involved in translation (DUF1610 family)
MGWTTVTTRFEVVRHKAVKSLPCPVCGKRLRRQRTFEQTINPYNRNEDGTVKTRNEIRAELAAQAAEWARQPETHPACQPAVT